MKNRLPLGYRIQWRTHVILLSMYGPADQDPATDVIENLKRERAARSAALEGLPAIPAPAAPLGQLPALPVPVPLPAALR